VVLRVASRRAVFVLASAWCSACSFDTSGVGTSAGQSLGDGGASGDTSDATTSTSIDATGTTQQGGDSSGEPPMACAGGGTCASAAPAGWSGPFAINTASPPNDGQLCPPGWDAGPFGGIGLDAAAASCNCDCVAGAASCTISVSYYGDQGCTTPVITGASDGGCDDLATGMGHGFVRAVGMPTGASCTPQENYVVPAATWATASVMCAPPVVADQCADGPCVPPPPPGFADAWCVVADGDVPCPAGPYDVRTVMASGVDDTRACTPCGCDLAGAVQCTGEIVEYTDLFCIVPVGTVPIDGECHEADIDNTSTWSVRYQDGAASYSCANNMPMPVGAAVARPPITVCCSG
jgi:hypothetical protein